MAGSGAYPRHQTLIPENAILTMLMRNPEYFGGHYFPTCSLSHVLCSQGLHAQASLGASFSGTRSSSCANGVAITPLADIGETRLRGTPYSARDCNVCLLARNFRPWDPGKQSPNLQTPDQTKSLNSEILYRPWKFSLKP